MKRITYLAAAAALVATSGLGAWAANAATDDSPAAHIRTAARHGADDPAGHHRHHGADDPAGHHRHVAAGHHSSSSSTEPGDDTGPGDDNGGSGEPEPGDHHGGGDDHGSDG
jgi:hypothetical protein